MFVPAGALAFNTIYDLVDDRGHSIGQALKVGVSAVTYQGSWAKVTQCLCVEMCGW
jgi:hypothetical protein